jgi:hypothetical protein
MINQLKQDYELGPERSFGVPPRNDWFGRTPTAMQFCSKKNNPKTPCFFQVLAIPFGHLNKAYYKDIL